MKYSNEIITQIKRLVKINGKEKEPKLSTNLSSSDPNIAVSSSKEVSTISAENDENDSWFIKFLDD